jgi:hypothetical protein
LPPVFRSDPFWVYFCKWCEVQLHSSQVDISGPWAPCWSPFFSHWIVSAPPGILTFVLPGVVFLTVLGLVPSLRFSPLDREILPLPWAWHFSGCSWGHLHVSGAPFAHGNVCLGVCLTPSVHGCCLQYHLHLLTQQGCLALLGPSLPQCQSYYTWSAVGTMADHMYSPHWGSQLHCVWPNANSFFTGSDPFPFVHGGYVILHTVIPWCKDRHHLTIILAISFQLVSLPLYLPPISVLSTEPEVTL